MIKEVHKEIFDGIAVPSRKGKENVRPAPSVPKQTPAQTARSAGQPGISTRANPSKDNHTDPSAGNPATKPNQRPQEFISIPMDIHQPRQVNDPSSDIEMKDVQTQKQDHDMEKTSAIKSCPPLWQSQISSQVGDTQVVSTILNTPVTMCLGEVLASSWELSD